MDRYMGLVVHVVNHSAQARSIRLTAQDREDLCAEVFLAIVKHDMGILRNFRGNSSLATYLAVIARRVVVRELLRKKSASRLAAGQDSSASSDAEHAATSGGEHESGGEHVNGGGHRIGAEGHDEYPEAGPSGSTEAGVHHGRSTVLAAAQATAVQDSVLHSASGSAHASGIHRASASKSGIHGARLRDLAVQASAEQQVIDRDEVERLLSNLQGQEADVVRMFHLEGKTYQEISTHIGMPENSIGPTLSRAREKMRRAGTDSTSS